MSYKLAGYMTAAAIALKLLLYLLDLSQERMAMLSIFMFLFVVLIGTFFAVRQYRAANLDSSVSSDVKAGMRTVALFAILSSLFIWIYYSYIDTHYFTDLISNRLEMAEKNAQSDDQLKQVEKTLRLFFSPQTHATLTLFGLMVCGAIYSFLVAIMMRKMPGFK